LPFFFAPLPFVSEAAAASAGAEPFFFEPSGPGAPLFSLARGGCGGFFFFGFGLSLTSGLLPVWKWTDGSR